MKGIYVAVAAISVLLMSACNRIDFKKTKGGMPYKLISGSGGTEIDSGNIVKLNIEYKVKDSVTFSSFASGQPIYIPVTNTGNPYDFTEVLASLKTGDSIYTVQLMDTFILRNPQGVPPNYKKGDTIKTSVKILSVFKNQQDAQKDQIVENSRAFDRDTAVQAQLARDIAGISSHLSQNGIAAQKTGKGTHVQIIEPGSGAQVRPGNFVSLKYKGATFDGKIFDTNMDASKGHTEPLVFEVGSPGMIRGFDEGVQALRQGSKAKLFIPSVLAYGPQPPSPDIKPFENLVFDIEVLQVSDKPIQPEPPVLAPARDSAARR